MAEQRMWLYANILQIYMYMTLIGEDILINAHFILTSARALCLSCALYSFHAEKMLQMGFTLKEIQESLSENRYDEVCATYMLLKRESSSSVNISINIMIILSAFTHMQMSFIHTYTATQVDHMYIIYNTAMGMYTIMYALSLHRWDHSVYISTSIRWLV